MGEIADMMINGLMCECCGEFMEDYEETGHPRRCAGCAGDDDIYSEHDRTMLRVAPKVNCDICGKRVKAAGLNDHKRAVHNLKPTE